MPPSAQACTKQLTVKHRWTELLQKLRWTSVWKGSNVPYCYYIAVPYGNNPPPCVYAMAGEAHGGGPRDSLVHLWQLYEHLSLWLGKCLIFTQINAKTFRICLNSATFFNTFNIQMDSNSADWYCGGTTLCRRWLSSNVFPLRKLTQGVQRPLMR